MTNRLVVILLCFFVVGCGSKGNPAAPAPPTTTPPPAAPTVTSVSFAANLAALDRVGATAQVTATATLSNGTTQNVTSVCTDWNSDNRSVLTVTQTGLMTAVGNGSSTVTAECSGRQGRGLVTLNLIPAEIWTISGKGNSVFTIPGHVKVIRARGVWDGRSTSNFIVEINDRVVVNEILREAPNRTYEGTHVVPTGDRSGRVVVDNSTQIAWTLTEVR